MLLYGSLDVGSLTCYKIVAKRDCDEKDGHFRALEFEICTEHAKAAGEAVVGIG